MKQSTLRKLKNNLPPDARKIIAERIGVSVGTVNQSLSWGSRVKDSTKFRVFYESLAYIKEYNELLIDQEAKITQMIENI